MTVWAPSDVRSITIPTHKGGCGQSHEAGELAPGEHFSVTCPGCEPAIIGLRHGWAYQESGVHLTPDEIGEVERQEADAKRQQNRTWGDPNAVGRALAEALAKNTPAGQSPNVLGLVAAMSPDERAALRELLGPAPVVPPAAPAVEAPPAAKPARKATGRRVAQPDTGAAA